MISTIMLGHGVAKDFGSDCSASSVPSNQDAEARESRPSKFARCSNARGSRPFELPAKPEIPPLSPFDVNARGSACQSPAKCEFLTCTIFSLAFLRLNSLIASANTKSGCVLFSYVDIVRDRLANLSVEACTGSTKLVLGQSLRASTDWEGGLRRHHHRTGVTATYRTASTIPLLSWHVNRDGRGRVPYP